MKASLEKACAFIQEAGFSHIKVELEAQLDREYAAPCRQCRNGRMPCTACDQRGHIIVREDEDGVECDNCHGYGRISCTNCQGHGEVEPRYSDTGDCGRYINGQLSAACRRALTFSRFYRDGSVDSELTFTLPISQIEYVLEVIEAFKKLAEECGRGIDTDGAGMHIAILPSQDNGHYPGSYRMPSDKLENFRTEVTKLLPALFFLATAGHRTRGYSFREPQVSSGTKYSAIYTHGGRCFEYRVFETCYDRPETFYDYVQVIANTLKFYHDPTLRLNPLVKAFAFTDGTEVARLFETPENIKIINATAKHLKPADKTLKVLKAERGVKGTIKELFKERKIRESVLKEDYKQHKKVYDSIVKKPLTESEKRLVDDQLISGYRYEAAIARVRGQQVIVPERKFIEDNISAPQVHTTLAV